MPKAIIRIYLTDGRWKALVVDADLSTKQFIPLIASKLNLTGKEDFSYHLLFESLENGKVVNELPASSKPFEISQKWGPKSGNLNRFVFKKRTDKLTLFDTAFESQWKSSLLDDKPEIPKQRHLLAATRTTSAIALSPRKDDEPTSPPQSPRQEDEPPKKKLPPGAQPLFFVGAKMALPPPKQRQEDGTIVTSPRENVQVITMYDVEIQSKRTKLKENQNKKQHKLDVHKQSILIWCNSILEKRNLVMNDLIQDLKSGVMLANILEICTGSHMKFSQNPRIPAQKLDNLLSCLNLLKQNGISIKGCTASDILNGNEPAVAGLMFLVVNKFKTVSRVASSRFSVAITSQGGVVVGADPVPNQQPKRESSSKPLPAQKTSKLSVLESKPAPVVESTPQQPKEEDPPVPPVPVEIVEPVAPLVPQEPAKQVDPDFPPLPEEPLEEAPPVPPVPVEELVEETQLETPEAPPPVPNVPLQLSSEETEELLHPVPPVTFPTENGLETQNLPESMIPLSTEPQRSPSISKDSVPQIPPLMIPISVEDELQAPPILLLPEMDPTMIDVQFDELNDFLTELANDLGVHPE